MIHLEQGMAFIGVMALVLGTLSWAAVEDLPEAERALANTVDPWGLAFSDQWVRFRSYFAPRPEAPFVLGLTHDLVKVWPNKYWFRGETFCTGDPEVPTAAQELWAAAGEIVSFQIAILPRPAAPEGTFRVAVEAQTESGTPLPTTVFREVFVQTARPAYPRFESERWPDPLIPAEAITVSGTDAGVFWIDVAIPPEVTERTASCQVWASDGNSTATCRLRLQIVPGLDLRPKDFPLVAWFWAERGPWKLDEAQFMAMCALLLEHHLIPLNALVGIFDPQDPSRFDARHAQLARWGQTLFELDSPSQPGFDQLYAHVKKQGWLDRCVIYSNLDEPSEEDFRTQNVPFLQEVHRKYPGLRVYLASDGHPQMEQGCDIWMTDLSARGYDPVVHRSQEVPELWHYYCHLPIHWQMRDPLVQAPNMQIDNDALEHRLALWISAHLGARGVFIWAGNAWDLAADFWENPVLSSSPAAFPYAGIHNGNGYLVYPPLAPGGAVLPSLRLKILRDGLEDLALFRAVEAMLPSLDEAAQASLKPLVEPVPGVFVNPYHFDRRPEVLREHRDALLKRLSRQE